MTTRIDDEQINAFQTFSTLLALLLPVLQLFFNFLPSSAQNIFVIKDILIPVTIIAGIFSYLLIIAFKNTTWFNIAFNRKKNKEYTDFQDQISYILQNESDEIKRETEARKLLRSPKKPPFYLNPLNIYILLIPLLLLFILIFLAVGIFGVGTENRLLILTQSVSYILSVALTSLTLAAFYINETNRKNKLQLDKDKYQKIIQLLFDNNSLPEFPKIEFVAQNSSDLNALRTYIKVNDKIVYEITTDLDGNILRQVLVNERLGIDK